MGDKYRAIQTVKHGGEYRVPGQDSEVFDWDEDQGDPDELVDAGVIEPLDESSREADSSLPEDFPGRTALVEAGIGSIEELQEVEDLTSISGIGEKTAEDIQEALET